MPSLMAVELGQRERDQRITELRAQLAVAARGDYHELLAVAPQAIGHRHCLPAGRQAAFPEFGAGVDIERAQIIIHRRSDKYDASGSNDRPTQIWRAADDMRC